MKTTRLLSVLVGLVVISFFAADASAMYHPTMGRFMQRDPGPDGMMAAPRVGTAGPAVGGGFIPRDQYADGMNLYEYAQSVPVVRRDPTGRWTEVERKGQPRARVCSDSADDSWESLARVIRHDEDEHHRWAKDEAGNPAMGEPEVGKWYTVPNKVIQDYGDPGWFGQLTVFFLRRAVRTGAQSLMQAGFLVEEHEYPGGPAPWLTLRDEDLWAYVYVGHGQWFNGRGTLLYDSKTHLKPGRYVHHRLAVMMLLACYSLDPESSSEPWTEYNPDTTRGRSLSEISEWEVNVSKYGFLVGFEGLGWLFPGTVRPGGLRYSWENAP